jgi:hypothetical protein
MADPKNKKASEAQESEAPAIPAGTIWIRSTLKPKPGDGHTVVLWEIDPLHSGGEVYVAGPTPVEAVLTPAVKKLLIEGQIEEVAAPEPATDKK